MANWRTLRVTNEYREIVNLDTGATRKVFFASDKQFKYLQSLRQNLGKQPLKTRPTSFAAGKAIDKLLDQINKRDAQQKLV